MNKGVFLTTIYKRQNAIRYTRHPSRQTPVRVTGVITRRYHDPIPVFLKQIMASRTQHFPNSLLRHDGTKNDFFIFFSTVYIHIYKRNLIGLFTKRNLIGHYSLMSSNSSMYRPPYLQTPPHPFPGLHLKASNSSLSS